MKKNTVTEKQVRDLAAEGLCQHEIAKKIGCAQGTIGYFIKKYNIAVADVRSSKNHAQKVYDSVEAQNMRIQEVVKSAGITPTPVQTLRMTPFQALEAKLKWPWINKVQQLTPSDLNPNFYDKLLEYHDFEVDEIAWMFGFKSLEAFGVWLKKWGYNNTTSKSAENIPKNIPDTADTSQPIAAEQFTAEDEKPIPHAVAADFDNDTTETENDERIDLTGWDVFAGSQRKQGNGEYMTVRNKIYIGRKVAVLYGWQRCSIAVRPDGEQVALKKSDEGVKIGQDNGRPCLVCKDAIKRIHGIVGPIARYRLLKEFPDMVVFTLDKEAV